MDSKNKSYFIKELESFGSLPLTEKEIIKRVREGEDIQILDLNIVRKNYHSLQKAFPYALIYSAVKALSVQNNIPSVTPEGGMISILNSLNSRFEVASLGEFRKLKSVGVSSDHIIFTHPDKTALEISESYQAGVRIFVSDSLPDIQLLADHAPKAKILVRISTNESGHGENFNDRFGLEEREAKKLLKQAESLSLEPIGLAFHIGTQSESPKLWKRSVQTAGRIFKDMRDEGMKLTVLSIGGGFPALNKEGIPSYQEYGSTIKGYLEDFFGKLFPKKIIIEPGRALSGMSGLTIGRIINAKTLGKNYVVTLSMGRFSAGLLGFGQKMNFYLKDEKGFYSAPTDYTTGSVYGKACASIDKAHIEQTTQVPKNLKPDDLVVVSGTGAYASDYATPNWCGIKSPTRIIFDSQ